MYITIQAQEVHHMYKYSTDGMGGTGNSHRSALALGVLLEAILHRGGYISRVIIPRGASRNKTGGVVDI